jgi:hypothetical protein
VYWMGGRPSTMGRKTGMSRFARVAGVNRLESIRWCEFPSGPTTRHV